MKVYVAMLFVDYGMCSECEYRLEEVKTFKNKEDAVNWQKEKENKYDYVEIQECVVE
jgi:C4-type Zn-finger protein